MFTWYTFMGFNISLCLFLFLYCPLYLSLSLSLSVLLPFSHLLSISCILTSPHLSLFLSLFFISHSLPPSLSLYFFISHSLPFYISPSLSISLHLSPWLCLSFLQ